MKKRALNMAMLLMAAIALSGCDGGSIYDDITGHPQVNLLFWHLRGPRVTVEIGDARFGNGDTYDYGLIEAGLEDGTIDFRIRNTGSRDLEIDRNAITIPVPQGFSITGPDYAVIRPDGYASYTMHFQVDGEGPQGTVLTIQSNAPAYTLNMGCTVAMPVVVVHGNGLVTTSIYRPLSNSFISGPAFSSAVTTGSSSFMIKNGPYFGQRMIIHGNSTTTSFYNPATMSLSPGTPIGGNVGFGSFNFSINSGTFASMTMIARGVSTNVVFYYDQVSDTSGTWAYVMPFFIGYGSHAVRLDSNQTLLFFTSQVDTCLYTDPTDSLALNVVAWNSIGAGAHSVFIPTGQGYFNEGQLLTVMGASTALNYYNITGPSFSLCASVLQGPNAGLGSHSFFITSGMYAGNLLIVHGGGVPNTTLYNLTTGGTVAGPGLFANAGNGAHSFPIRYGPWAGSVIVVHGGGASTTSIYYPSSGLFDQGPNLTDAAGVGGTNFTLK